MSRLLGLLNTKLKFIPQSLNLGQFSRLCSKTEGQNATVVKAEGEVGRPHDVAAGESVAEKLQVSKVFSETKTTTGKANSNLLNKARLYCKKHLYTIEERDGDLPQSAHEFLCEANIKNKDDCLYKKLMEKSKCNVVATEETVSAKIRSNAKLQPTERSIFLNKLLRKSGLVGKPQKMVTSREFYTGSILGGKNFSVIGDTGAVSEVLCKKAKDPCKKKKKDPCKKKKKNPCKKKKKKKKKNPCKKRDPCKKKKKKKKKKSPCKRKNPCKKKKKDPCKKKKKNPCKKKKKCKTPKTVSTHDDPCACSSGQAIPAATPPCCPPQANTTPKPSKDDPLVALGILSCPSEPDPIREYFGDCYKNKEYYRYKLYSYYDLICYLTQFRLEGLDNAETYL